MVSFTPSQPVNTTVQRYWVRFSKPHSDPDFPAETFP